VIFQAITPPRCVEARNVRRALPALLALVSAAAQAIESLGLEAARDHSHRLMAPIAMAVLPALSRFDTRAAFSMA